MPLATWPPAAQGRRVGERDMPSSRTGGSSGMSLAAWPRAAQARCVPQHGGPAFSRKGGSPAGPSWLQSSGKLRPPASPSLRDSIRGLDGRTPATKHCEPFGVCIKDEVVSLRNASEMMLPDLVGVRQIVEGDVEVI